MWFFYALSFALITSVSVLIAKRIMREIDEYLYLALSSLFSLPFLFLIVVYFYQIPKVDEVFVRSIFIGSSIGVVAAIFAYRAIKISDVSLISPVSAFNPIFTLIISFIFLGEVLTEKIVLGILLICMGAYLLELSRVKKDLLAPFKVLLAHKGIQFSLIAYFIWAITPIFEKTAIIHTTPQVPPFVSLVGFSFSTLVFLAISSKSIKVNLAKVKKLILVFLPLGVLGGLGQTTAMIAFSSGNLGAVTSIFKLSMIFTVILGYLFFREVNLKGRLLGSSVMLLGVILLVT